MMDGFLQGCAVIHALDMITASFAAVCRVLFLGAWHGWHAALSFMVAQRATKVKQLLDPISSGMMIL